ncbi:TraR/DksA C4-type zinc finger protein [Jatrophihabitans telluris]|uniref:TraR/DksA C4-type zinc finger protein n=1 Tax=Jatrophihabitans telluris TaxID=2038343 RepID=A0ABY4R1W9_9ACTN|nr:TraR/DksA C4-type zinc finger protein [Jatrophihabitans telluris]UQX89130.1 TraR/DksA C4-type zinc finger protein [Jatrophihabitans telluris]
MDAHLSLVRLRELREAAVDQLAALDAEFHALQAAAADSNVDDEHDPEGTTIAFERAQLDASRQRAKAQVAEAERARRDVHEGRYGWCEYCGEEISADRLEALPLTRRCIDCVGR